MKILLVDDHQLLADALVSLIELRFPQCSVSQAATLAEALRQLDDTVQLVLLDLGLPDAQELQALQAIRDAAPTVRLVVISADDRPDTVEAAIELGASGFVPKRASSQQLMQALTETLEGGIALPATLLSSVTLAEAPALTMRQQDVLRLLLQGQPNKLICRSLSLSESSVKTHLEAIYRRLGVSSRTQAMAVAARLQLRL